MRMHSRQITRFLATMPADSEAEALVADETELQAFCQSPDSAELTDALRGVLAEVALTGILR